MNTESNPEVSLRLTARDEFAHVAATFVETTASAFGLKRSDALPLTLAAEEVFVYLCKMGAPGRLVTMNARGTRYYAEVEFLFQPREFEMRTFNLAPPGRVADGRTIEETGLLIASRMVDRFHFHEDERGLRITFRKEKTYPEAEAAPTSVTPLQHFTIRKPDGEDIKELVRLARMRYADQFLSQDFLYPGKTADMAAEGVYRALTAADDAGRIGGGILWTFRTSKIVWVYGPYIFDRTNSSPMAEELVNACIAAIAKSGAVGLLSLNPTPELPAQYFEELGSLSLCGEDGDVLEAPVFFKHLMEDAGTAVRSHPSLIEFLKREYRRLALAREVLPGRPEGERGSPFSVVSAEFDKPSASVILRPVWWGEDAEQVVADDVKILLNEGIPNVFFHIDLGRTWQSYFAPAAQRSGFEPRLILPYCGKGDIVVFQLRRSG